MPKKPFMTYEQQINHLKSKKLIIENEEIAKHHLQHYSYYSLISGYKGIFKVCKNGDYKPDASFNKIYTLYIFDEQLRHMILHEIIRIEKHIKSLYSYSFCQLYGDEQKDYENANNYDYLHYQNDVNVYIGKIQDTLKNSNKFKYVSYNLSTYQSVPLWVIINTFTFGTISKMFMFSQNRLQSQIAKNFPNIYPPELSSMLSFLTNFRNVCAHGERLYNYKTRNAIPYMPVHKFFSTSVTGGKNDFFSVLVCLKYLSQRNDFIAFITALEEILDYNKTCLGKKYLNEVLNQMGFPSNWKDILK